MNTSSAAVSPQTLLVNGQLDEALHALSAQVKDRPDDASLRVFMFQLLAVLGDWERAAKQLQVAAGLDPQNALLATAYGFALQGERERAAVFAGNATPTISGEPAAWHAALLGSLRALGDGNVEQALDLRDSAFDAAPTIAGTIDEEPFAWIADSDPRFGPCLEVILKSGYTWVPFTELKSLSFDAPADLRDKVWAPVRLTWRGGAEAIGFVPCRYPGSERSNVAALKLATSTAWVEKGANCFAGCGQRMFVTDTAEYPLLDLRSITFDAIREA